MPDTSLIATPADLERLLRATTPLPLTVEQVRLLVAAVQDSGLDPDLRFTGLAYDSRAVRGGELFVALKGEKVDGHAYLRDAWERGARAAIVASPTPDLPLPWIATADTRRALSRLSDAAFGQPSRQLHVIGITGTKGKTSTSYFLQHILECAGHPTGVIGTLGLHAYGITLAQGLTTPESLDLHRMLACLREAGCTHVAMEVSAHGIHFQRTSDIFFKRVIFTNLGQDHLDFFGTLDAYGAAKRRLFERGQYYESAILNSDDPFGVSLESSIEEGRLIRYGEHGQVSGRLLASRPDGLLCQIGFQDGSEAELLIPVGGKFSLSNILAAVATAESLGLTPEQIATALTVLPSVPGRHEVVSTRDDDITVVVDYAHTPESVAAILASADRSRHSRLIALVGCGGDRDRSKRPQMGRLAHDAVDQLVVTSDNPRTEDPAAIIAEILTGIPKESIGSRVSVEADRAVAIRQAIISAPPRSAIYILGKGHEPYQILRDSTIAFDDREHARAALKVRREGGATA
ncbi:MAG: UDP-N-acetylmuramoyl-L-alanyl-D-glutamate--2,6-diaminopimelate ligase [bacterium]